jgi:hypothetical protein
MKFQAAALASERANAVFRRSCWLEGVRWVVMDDRIALDKGPEYPAQSPSLADLEADDFEVVEPAHCGEDGKHEIDRTSDGERWCIGCGWYLDRMPREKDRG